MASLNPHCEPESSRLKISSGIISPQRVKAWGPRTVSGTDEGQRKSAGDFFFFFLTWRWVSLFVLF